MASPTQWTWVWAKSGKYWRTGKPSVLQSLGTWRLRHDSELNNNENNSKCSLEMFLVNVLGVWFGRRIWLKYLLSWLNFLLHFTRKKKIMCVLVPQLTAGDLVPEDWLKLTISLISQHGGWKESIGPPALCCNGCCWQPPIPDFMCFSSCLGGQWRAKGRWRICIYWTNLLLELGQLLATSLWVKLNYWKMFSSDPVDPQETVRGDGSIPDFCGALILMMLSPNHGSLKYARKSGSL